MAELSLSLPVKGEEAPGADAKVNAAFTEIQTQFNGKIADVNIETNRALVTTNGVYSARKGHASAAAVEMSATRSSVVILEAKGGETITKVNVNAGVVFAGSAASVTVWLTPGSNVAPTTSAAGEWSESHLLL